MMMATITVATLIILAIALIGLRDKTNENVKMIHIIGSLVLVIRAQIHSTTIMDTRATIEKITKTVTMMVIDWNLYYEYESSDAIVHLTEPILVIQAPIYRTNTTISLNIMMMA